MSIVFVINNTPMPKNAIATLNPQKSKDPITAETRIDVAIICELLNPNLVRVNARTEITPIRMNISLLKFIFPLPWYSSDILSPR